MSTARLPLTRAQGFLGQLLRFAWIELQCCAFAIAVFVGLAGSALIWSRWDPPLARYDALLLYVIAVQVLFVATKRESWRELGVVCAFHLAGFALEVFKVAVGSWEYPDAALTKIAGVPLYAGFMYAAVGSYVCQAFRRFDLTVSRYRTGAVLVLALAAYANFFTHHFLPDLRVVIALGFLVVTVRSRVWFTVGAQRYWMPLPLSFVLIGFFLWIAENLATFLGAWRYPDQGEAWRMVHAGKFGSWVLLVSLSFVLVSLLDRRAAAGTSPVAAGMPDPRAAAAERAAP
ncbi:DUF817 domain-containing protein [Tsukamurella sp. M9C]|uniref:DUF817 domain-containing protein n=1 Tax=unclassified Tsukamurella TaxID=2633480 RepID=UPI001CCA91DD|nr:DUF817 domain-containing protein [Tsukamurella sp. M9C]MCA0157367.1 DUF817 domain-containing protein [Tsukamurella sp. M9C]